MKEEKTMDLPRIATGNFGFLRGTAKERRQEDEERGEIREAKDIRAPPPAPPKVMDRDWASIPLCLLCC